MAGTESTVETVNVNNLKTLGEACAHSVALAMQNAVAHQAAMNQASAMFMARISRTFAEVDPTEASSIVSLIQQALKGAQTSPPPTP